MQCVCGFSVRERANERVRTYAAEHREVTCTQDYRRCSSGIPPRADMLFLGPTSLLKNLDWKELRWLKFNRFWDWFLIPFLRIQFDCFRVKIDRNRLNTIQIQNLINRFDRFESISIDFNTKTIELNFEKRYQE